MRTQLSVAEGLELLTRVQFDVQLIGLLEDDEDAEVPLVRVSVKDVVYDLHAPLAPVARITIEANEPVSIRGLVLHLSVTLREVSEEEENEDNVLATWDSEVRHDDMEVPYDVYDSIAWRDVDTSVGLHTARSFYSRSLPRTWTSLDVACSSLAVARLLS